MNLLHPHYPTPERKDKRQPKIPHQKGDHRLVNSQVLQNVLHIGVLNAPSMRPLCAHYVPSMRHVCALYAPSMRPLCAHYAHSMCPLCAL